MRPLSASAVIEVWERGVGQPAIERGLTLLAACGEDREDDLAALSIGRREARLAELHQRLFGDALHAYAECPQCRERLEYSLSIRDLEMTGAPDSGELSLSSGGIGLRLRPPNSADLIAAGRCETLEAARDLLARRCILGAEEQGRAVPVEMLPGSIVEGIAERLREADPRAETLIRLTCAACRCQWQVALDMERFLWAKVAALAKRLMREVHVLARAYGWREADILALSAARRRFYLEMAGL